MSAWYYAVNGERSGPVEFTELERLAREGGLRAGDLVWTADFGEQWKPAWEVDGLVFGDAPKGADEPQSRPAAAFSAHEGDPSGRTGLEPVQDICRQAREALRGRYWTMIGALLLMSVIQMAINFLVSSLPLETSLQQPLLVESENALQAMLAPGNLAVLAVALAIQSVVMCVNVLLQYGVSTVMALNIARKDAAEVGNLFEGFSDAWRILWAAGIMGLKILLWSLLFIIPGIVAFYSYSMTLFILRDNPGMKAAEAVRESKRIMTGYKGKLLGMHLWFTLLALLCMLPSLAAYFVNPMAAILLLVPMLLVVGFWIGPYATVAAAQFYRHLPGRTRGAANR